MAARISASVVDFAVVAVKIPVQQKNSFLALKGKVEVRLTSDNFNQHHHLYNRRDT